MQTRNGIWSGKSNGNRFNIFAFLLLCLFYVGPNSEASAAGLIPETLLHYNGVYGAVSDPNVGCMDYIRSVREHGDEIYWTYLTGTYAVEPDVGPGCWFDIVYKDNGDGSPPNYDRYFQQGAVRPVYGCLPGYETIDNGWNEPKSCLASDAGKQKGSQPSVCGSTPGPSLFVGDPINLTTGNSFQTEIDLAPRSQSSLSFKRFYNSADGIWRHSYSAHVVESETGVALIFEDGREAYFSNEYSADNSEDGSLARSGEGWVYTSKDGQKFEFNNNGALSHYSNGADRITIDRTANTTTVKDRFGRSISYSAGQFGLSSMSSGGTDVTYQYSDSGQLIKATSNRGGSSSSRQYHYTDSSNGRLLTGITDEKDVLYVSWAYDDKGRAVSNEFAGGVGFTGLSYSFDNTYVTSPSGETNVYHFSAINGVRFIDSISGQGNVDCPNTNSTFTYDDEGRLLSKIDKGGMKTTYTSNSAGLELSRTEADGSPLARTTRTSWTDSGKIAEISNAATKSSFTYNTSDQIINLTRTDLSTSQTRSTTYIYNDAGLLSSVDGPRTDVSDLTTYDYDSEGNLVSVTNAIGHVTRFVGHDLQGNPQSSVDENGVLSAFTYTPEGWLSSVSEGSSSVSLDYDAIGQVTKLTQGDGSWMAFTWDSARRLTDIANNQGDKAHYEIDSSGSRTATVLSNSGGIQKQQSMVYDVLNRLIRTSAANGNTDTYSYDVDSNVTGIVDYAGVVASFKYDGLNRLIESIDPLNGITQYGYDSHDNVSQVKDPRGVTTEYTYDGLGNLQRLSSQDSGVTSFDHDSAGNIIRKTDARGVVTEYEYDALNRLTARRYPANPSLSVIYAYDMTADGNRGIGRLTAIQDSGGLIGYRYDDHGNLTEQIRSVTVASVPRDESLEYGYDVASRLTRIDYPAGFSVNYQRNAAGQVAKVELAIGAQPPTAIASDISFMPFGPLKGLTWGNGIVLKRQYDKDYWLIRQNTGSWTSQFGFDLHGNITYRSHNLFGTAEYQYDALDRLIDEKVRTDRMAYTYDATGNRTQRITYSSADGTEKKTATQTLVTAANSNRLAKNGSLVATLDAAGNILQQTSARRFVYNEQGRLQQVLNPDALYADYRYNALGQRTLKQVYSGGSVISSTTFLYGADGQLLGQAQYGATGKKTLAQYWIWLDGMPLAGIEIKYASNGSTIASTRQFYLHSDHLNTPRLATDQTQKLVWSWNSDAFGVGAANTDVDGDGIKLDIPLRFPGQQYDAHSGLNYNYFRDYDPQTGRYVESDPIGLNGGPNTYGYVGANPIGFSDPLGLVRWGEVANNSVGLLGAGTGVFLGGALITAPTGVSQVLGAAVLTKSMYSWGTNWYGLGRAFSDDASYDIPKSFQTLPRTVASGFSCSVSAQRIADATDLALDFASGRVTAGFKNNPSGYLRSPVGYPAMNSNQFYSPATYGEMSSRDLGILSDILQGSQTVQYGMEALQ